MLLSPGIGAYPAADAALDEMLETALGYTGLTRQFTMPATSQALGHFGRFRPALEALDGQDVNEHLMCIAVWVTAFEKMRDGLTVEVVEEVQRVGAWSRLA